MTNLTCSIDNHSLLLVRGADARKFLQGQVTCDIDRLTIEALGTQVADSASTDSSDHISTITSTLGAHCSHKGRIIFNFIAMAIDEQTIALNIPTDMMDIAITALKKYIVFSKAELIDASNSFQLIGIEGEDAIATLQSTFATLPEADNEAIHTAKGIVLRLTNNRYELWLTTEQAEDIHSQFAAYTGTDSSHWDIATINAGIAYIRPSTTEMFTPHATNLQMIGNGVSFKKGCYTGQEVVARMHYLGKLKRQTFLFEQPHNNSDPLPSVGDPVFSPDKKQSIGDIASIARHKEHIRLLAVVTVEQAEQDTTYIDAQFKQKLHLLTLPYAIPKE